MPKLDIAGNNSFYGIDSDVIETGVEVKFQIPMLMGGISSPKTNDVELKWSMSDPVGTYYFTMPDHDVTISIETVSSSNPFGMSQMNVQNSMFGMGMSNSNFETNDNLKEGKKNE